MLLPVLDKDNADEWVKKAGAMTTLQLQEEVAAAQKKEGGAPAQITSEVSTMTFKVHKDQKETIEAAIDKAKQMANTEVATVALEHICLDFLPSPKAKGKKADGEMPPILDVFAAIKEKHGDDLTEALKEIFGAFEAIYPNVDITVALSQEAEKG